MGEKISIIIPVYNVEKNLKKCMDSLLNQTYRNLQIILVDDGSTDTSGILCDSYAASEERVTALHIVNQGVSVARNTGLDKVEGTYVSFVDSDDYVEPEFIEKLYQGMANAQLSICGFYEVYPKKEKITRTMGNVQELNQEEALQILLKEDGFRGYLWNKMFRADILEDYNIRFQTDLSLWEDVLFDFTYLAHCTHIFYNPAPYYDYVFHETSLSHSENDMKKTYDAIRAIKRMDKQLQSEKPKVRRQLKNRLLTCALSVLRVRAIQGKQSETEVYVRNAVKIIKKYRSSGLSRTDKLSAWLCRIHPTLFYSIYRMKNKGKKNG